MNTDFSVKPKWEDADGFVEALLNAHSGMSREQSEVLNARLILLMANQIADQSKLLTCIDLAKQSG